ncbi:hypothetical protein BD311DRAFT_4301 [Dichomitus squalens]|uniref:Uncharacterized protein n=1 Tax=Dichomitus squalens TaxID=114155 RepID=A0A4V2K268_9APHY|nr:hypothetical protein BD311DRAFT_4301 [Dichomitus squalens]
MGGLQSLLYDDDADSDENRVDIDDDPAEPVRHVRWLLSELGLPMELVLDIMDLAEYYPAVFAERSDPVRMRSDQHTRGDNCSALLYLVSPPLPAGKERESWRMKSVMWHIEGRDQGWGGEQQGTFHGSYSWYEACILRPINYDPETLEAQSDHLDAILSTHDPHRTTADLVPFAQQQGWTLVPNAEDRYAWHVQSNKVAEAAFGRYAVEWRAGQSFDTQDAEEHGYGNGTGFLQALRPGDRVGLVMRAQYGGWENLLRHADVKLVYDVR